MQTYTVMALWGRWRTPDGTLEYDHQETCEVKAVSEEAAVDQAQKAWEAELNSRAWAARIRTWIDEEQAAQAARLAASRVYRYKILHRSAIGTLGRWQEVPREDAQ